METNLSNKSKYWWLMLIGGIVLLIMGIWVFNHPVSAYLGLSIYFSITFFVIGIFQIVEALSNTQSNDWGWQLTVGILDFIVGIILINNPVLSLTTLPIIIGFALMFRGISLITVSIGIKKLKSSYWWIVLTGGILITILAFLMIISPVQGAMSIVTLTGLGFICAGIFTIIMSFQVKKLPKTQLSVT